MSVILSNQSSQDEKESGIPEPQAPSIATTSSAVRTSPKNSIVFRRAFSKSASEVAVVPSATRITS